MNAKKLALIGVLVLVVIGCVVAAGCTSTTTTTQTTTMTSDDQIIGTWIKDDGSSVFIIDANKTGTYLTSKDDSTADEVSILWKKNEDGTYALINGGAKATVTLDAVKGIFTTDSGSVYRKPISDASGYSSDDDGYECMGTDENGVKYYKSKEDGYSPLYRVSPGTYMSGIVYYMLYPDGVVTNFPDN